MVIENRGVAPPYARYELRVKLSRAGERIVQPIATTSKSWMPQTPIIVQKQLSIPADLKPGEYDLAVGLFDFSGVAERPVEFALKSSICDAVGYYKLTSVSVSATNSSAR
jgi:hypothetical protein